jgi:hypothetical protein
VEFSIAKGGGSRVTGQARDISLGGMFVVTDTPAPFGGDVTVTITLPGQRVPFTLPGIVRWVGNGGMGIQFKMLGARETHAITEVVRESEESEVKF